MAISQDNEMNICIHTYIYVCTHIHPHKHIQKQINRNTKLIHKKIFESKKVFILITILMKEAISVH